MLLSWSLGLVFIWSQLETVCAFTQYLLKDCKQAGFCHRNRHYAEEIQKSERSYYSIDADNVYYDENEKVVRATILKTIFQGDNRNNEQKVELPFTLGLLQDGATVRFTIDENRPHKNYLPSSLNQRRYNETSKWAFEDWQNLPKYEATMRKGFLNRNKVIVEGDCDYICKLKVELYTKSFLIKIYYKEALIMVVNERSLLNYEHLRAEQENESNLLLEESDFNMFHDNFKYSKDDTMPFGPESVALDFTFSEFEHLYGLPEHPGSFRLQDTSNGEPYRLYSTDVFRYDIGTRMPMYGNIPFVIGNNQRAAAGIFWVNAADTWVDFKYTRDAKKTPKSQSHWMSETGIIDVVLFFGDTPSEITEKYTAITGRPALPKQAAIGYHQCRWNYNDELDVLTVDSSMDRDHFPYDNIWLDLEYTDNKKFFTWKPNAFPNPDRLLKKLAKLGRDLTVLIDPHLKAGYNVSNAVVADHAAIKNHEGDTFYGTCWPGKSVWIDTMGDIGRKLWAKFYEAFLNGAKNLDIWNDMNEPSIFDGPETTAPKDLIHAGGFEQRALHNVYPLTVHQATYDGMINIFNESSRPFIIARGHFSGSQRTAGTWTGDNVANWDYLKISIPMILSSNVAGMPFTGADIAGFFDNPEDELVVRWYQAGLWYPFFRAHAHIDSLRREPYLFEEPIKSHIRNAIQLRYNLLPTFYTAFYEASIDGTPIMKPMVFEKPEFLDLALVEDQFYLGNSGLVVKPIVEKDAVSTTMLVAEGLYYDYWDLRPYRGGTIIPDDEFVENLPALTFNVKPIRVNAPLDKIPILLEGGHIISKREKYRRSSKLSRNDAYTLVVAPDNYGNAEGKLYADDGETLAHKHGEYLLSTFTMQNNELLTGHPTHNTLNKASLGNTLIDKIIIASSTMKSPPKDTVTVKKGLSRYAVKAVRTGPYETTIFNPLVHADETWEIDF
ncbi:related to Glucosidase 2 subunit alpha [Zygosaccharomyces bailii]|nr:related to Glucosidase 2 subunit alpha [Zygosaccharomyces bailii]